jgi:hypothetical protein
MPSEIKHTESASSSEEEEELSERMETEEMPVALKQLASVATAALSETTAKKARAAHPAASESSAASDSEDDDEPKKKARAASDARFLKKAPKKARGARAASDSEDEEEAPKSKKRAVSESEEEEAPKSKKRAVVDNNEEDKKKKRAAEESDDDDDDSSSSERSDADEAPMKWTQKVAEMKSKKARALASSTKPKVQKQHVEKWIAASDHAAIRANALNSRKEPRSLFTTSKFKLSGLGGLSPLRFAIVHVFRASKREHDDALEAALETVRALLVDCKVSPTDTEARHELLDLIASRAAKAVPDSAPRCGVKVLEVLLEAPFLEESASVAEAAACFAASGEERMLKTLLTARGTRLTHAGLFETVTQTMTYGTGSMVLTTLQILKRWLRPTTCHPKTGSTLLHFAAKRGEYVREVLRLCDAKAEDKKGRTALALLERAQAPADLIALVREAMTTPKGDA